MRPTAHDHDSLQLGKGIIAGIAIHLYGSLEVMEEPQGYFGISRAFMVMEEYHRNHDAPDKPYVTLYRPMLLVVDDWHCRLIGQEITIGQSAVITFLSDFLIAL